MSNLFGHHYEQDLVRYLDGELSARRAQKVERHLEACEPCRAEFEALRATLADCAAYRQDLAAQAPAAPAPWRDLYRDFSRIDESLANNSLLVRLIRPLVHSGVPRWAFVVGLATLIVLLSLNQLRQAPSVQAATLLRRAVAVSQNQPQKVHRIRVRSNRQPEFTRLAGTQAAIIELAQAQAVAALFHQANWDWSNPLSAQAFEQWRGQQVHKTDEVSAVEEPQFPSEHFTRIRTVSEEGDLEAASITLDTGNYEAVSERLEFRDKDWVELSEIAETSTDAGGSGVATVGVPVRAAEPPSRPAAFAPGSMASISDEIQVLSALRGIEADLGEQVEVALTGGKVVVSGEGISPHRQEEIRAAVANVPHVEVEFTALPAVTVPPQIAGSSAVSAPVSPMEAGIEKQLGGHAEFDRFSTQLQDLDNAAMQRMFALHNLALKFPAEEEAKLTAQDLQVLHELSRQHTAVLAEKIAAMEKILLPTLASLGGTAASVHPAGHTSWQPASEDIFRGEKQVDHLVSQLLGMTPGATRTLPSDLLTSLKDLEGNLDDCQKLLK
jgi:hypothetical protein